LARHGGSGVSPADFFPGIWDTNVVDGHVYGIPWYVDTRLLFYRTDLLAAAGYDQIPQTWSGWRDAMEKIKARTGKKGFAILLPVDEWQQPVIFGLQKGAVLLRDDGRGAFSDPRFREALEFYLGLYRDGLAPVFGNNQVANLYQQFAAGDFALYITGPWNIGEFRRRLPPELQDKWNTAPVPGPDGPGASVAGGSSLSMFHASEHKEEAWKLIQFLSEPAQQVRFYSLTGDLPAHKAAWTDPVLADDPQARAFWDQLQRVVPTPKVPEWEQIAMKLQEHTETAIRGRATAAEALAALDRDVDRILEKRRFLLARQAEQNAAAKGAM
jgi:multiple sugar transport system substrate-binding protein